LYESYLNITFGFVSIIQHFVVGKKIPIRLDDCNQDICEHHFGHMRSGAGDYSLVHADIISRSERLSQHLRTAGVATKYGNSSHEAFKQRGEVP
jgi:hypothetical protein